MLYFSIFLPGLFIFEPHSTVVPAKNICKMFAAFGTCFFRISISFALSRVVYFCIFYFSISFFFFGISFIPILTFWLKRKFNLNVQHFFMLAQMLLFKPVRYFAHSI